MGKIGERGLPAERAELNIDRVANDVGAPVGGHSIELTAPRSLKEVTRYVPVAVQCLLWGKAAGRCEFAGCNEPLWKSRVTQEQVNIGQKAHIYAFRAGGARGGCAVDLVNLQDLSNLMLVCHACHRKIDKEPNGGRYTVSLLQQMKKAHEKRIERITALTEDKRSHVVLYGANIGDHSSPLNYREAALAMFPRRYPAADSPIDLATVSSSFSDRDASFWATEAENLLRKFRMRVRERISSGEATHLSVFALAPQPLLVLLGTLLGDIVPADVYQRHREPSTWQWPENVTTPAFKLRRPDKATGSPALVVALSATVTPDRVASVIGRDASIWLITVEQPHNDLTKSPEHLVQLRSLLRSTLDQIKSAHGQMTALHIFPVASVSAAVELGRVRMPKADMPWVIYDQVNGLGGFIRALTIPVGEQE